MTPRLYLDCDGVLADFDARAEEIFGGPTREWEEKNGTRAFWETIRETPNFFRDMPLMKDARELYESLEMYRPIVLTGVPQGGWAELQKVEWIHQHFPGTPIGLCKSREKKLYCRPGDVLVDDWDKYMKLWQEAGGNFILHESAAVSIPLVHEHMANYRSTAFSPALGATDGPHRE